MNAQIIKLTKETPEHTLDQIAKIIQEGGVIIFPTDTVYGLGGDAFNPKVIEAIYQLKGRAPDKPLSLHLGSVPEIEEYCRPLTAKQKRAIERLLPGPFTLLLWASPNAPKASVSVDGKLGVRLPKSESFEIIYRRARTPLVGTSVNPSGEPPLTDITEIIEKFWDKVDLILSTDEPMTRQSSAVIDLTRDPPTLLRGEMSARLLQQILEA